MLDLDDAVHEYSEGRAVVVKATDGGVLHGRETLQAIIDTGASLECSVIRDVDREQFEASDWPEILEAARQVFMRDQFPRHAP